MTIARMTFRSSLQMWTSCQSFIIIVLLFAATTTMARPSIQEDYHANERLLPLWTNEDVRFAQTRCRSDANPGGDQILSAFWMNGTYPDNHETHCFIKCFLKKLGLINLRTGKLNSKRIQRFLENIADEQIEDCWKMSNPDEYLPGTCLSYYKKWMALKKNCSAVIDVVMHKFMNVSNKIIKPLPPSKALGQSATEFCNTQKFNTSNGLRLRECAVSCIFKHFRYFDAYGRLDETEIRHSFEENNFLKFSNLTTINQCIHRANSLYELGECEMANELNNCLYKITNVFPNVYQLRDKLTRML